MASASHIDIGTSATLIAEGETDGPNKAYDIAVKNKTGSASIFLGGSDVTTGTGFEWEVTDGIHTARISATESLYGRVASGTQTVHVLKLEA